MSGPMKMIPFLYVACKPEAANTELNACEKLLFLIFIVISLSASSEDVSSDPPAASLVSGVDIVGSLESGYTVGPPPSGLILGVVLVFVLELPAYVGLLLTNTKSYSP